MTRRRSSRLSTQKKKKKPAPAAELDDSFVSESDEAASSAASSPAKTPGRNKQRNQDEEPASPQFAKPDAKLSAKAKAELAAAKKLIDEKEPLDQLQCFWEVPAVAHFCSLFRVAFKLGDFDIEDLEEALLNDCATEESRSSLIIDLLINLLKGLVGRKDITLLNYNQFMHDLFEQRWAQVGVGPNPLGPSREHCWFHRLPMVVKLKLLHQLCEWRLDRPDVELLIKSLSSDALRVNSLGRDEEGNTYWYFYGTRLYREDPEPLKLTLFKPPCFSNLSLIAKQAEAACGGYQRPVEQQQPNRPTAAERRAVYGTKKKGGRKSRKRKKTTAKTPKAKQAKLDDSASVNNEDESNFGDDDDNEEDDDEEGDEDEDNMTMTTLASDAEDTIATDDENTNQSFSDLVRRMYKSPRKDDDEDTKQSLPESVVKPSPDTKESDLTKLKSEPSETTKTEPTDSSSQQADQPDSSVKAEQLADADEKPSTSGTAQQPEENEAKPQKEAGARPDTPTDVDWQAIWQQPALQIDYERAPRWHLQCSSLEHWQQLVEKFADSKARANRHFHRTLAEEFVPSIEELFKEKERETRRKLDALEPRRQSDRIQIKQIQRDEEERQLKEREAAERQKLARSEDIRSARHLAETREERRRLREIEKERNEKIRLRAKEERERRLELRQRRAEYVNAGMEIPDELRDPLAFEDADDDDLNQIDIQMELDSMYERLEKVLDALRDDHNSAPFREPVSTEIAPNYYDVIKQPMDLATIETKIIEKEYKNKMEFIDDVNQMLCNCLTYNGANSDYTSVAQKLERTFIRIWRRFFPASDAANSERTKHELLRCNDRLGALGRQLQHLCKPEGERDSDSGGQDSDTSLNDDYVESGTAGRLSSQSKKLVRGLDSSFGRSRSPATATQQQQRRPNMLYPQRAEASGSGTPTFAEALHRPSSLNQTMQARAEQQARHPNPAYRQVSQTTQQQYGGRPSQSPAAGQRSQQTRMRPSTATTTSSAASTNNPVYLIPGSDGQNRLFKFVIADNRPAPNDMITQILPQIRRDVLQFPPSQLTTVKLDYKRDEATGEPDGQAASTSGAGGGAGGSQSTPSRGGASSSQQQQQQLPPLAHMERLLAELNQLQPSASFGAEGTREPIKTFHLGGQSYVLLECGVPWLAQQMPDAAARYKYLKIKRLDAAALESKVHMLRHKQQQQANTSAGSSGFASSSGAVAASKPVCSVAPQRAPNRQQPPPQQQHKSSTAQQQQSQAQVTVARGSTTQINITTGGDGQQAQQVISVHVPSSTNVVVNTSAADDTTSTSSSTAPRTQ